jgi:dienelactone hydrolase
LGNEYSISTEPESAVGPAGWLAGERGLMVYDNYDIWLLDPSGKSNAINLTNGYGKRHHTKLRLTYGGEYFSAPPSFNEHAPLLISAFNTLTKYNGFYEIRSRKKVGPVLLTMEPCTMYHVSSQLPKYNELVGSMRPIKARDADVWIISRMTASEAPNYLTTTNFKKFRPLTDLQPQRNVNWLTSELINWKENDGTPMQGILYKPEDFDPQKKYPLLFNYYEELSQNLYEFPPANLTQGPINIPWFVSHGYLVFTPDIHLTVASRSGKTNGENAFDAILSAVKYLGRFPWIDLHRMGLQGHSFAGGLTNYLVTHTQLFKAAAEASGGSDAISSYLSLSGVLGAVGESRLTNAEVGQGREGASLWKRPELYLRGVTVLRADRVTTPLLVFHNKADVAVPWGQALELFLSLRRLGKKVWMLQYDNGTHIVSGPDAMDYTIRLTQFFDFYLKNALPPKWMTEGIPAARKGIDLGLELDSSRKLP